MGHRENLRAKQCSAARIDRWKTPEFISVFHTTVDNFTEADQNVIAYLDSIRARFYDEFNEEKVELETSGDLLRTAKELIFDVRDGKPVFYMILYSFNVKRGEIQISHILDREIDDEAPESVTEEVCNTLALAHLYEVPVYPNTDELAEELANYYKEMMVNGFVMPDEEEGRKRYLLTKSPGSKLEMADYVDEISFSEPRYAAELFLIKTSFQKELNRLSEVKELLGSLELAISRFQSLLSQQERNENELQRHLTENPVLLGLEYRKVIPKYRLGAQYEMDYALQRSSGLVDLMEIEASNLPIFNKKGDPSHHLTHAEQQVLDWLAWIERNHSYVREGLPEITKPLGFVIIGRSTNLDDQGRRRLNQRNNLFRGSLYVLTYDDVLEKARIMHEILIGVRR